LYQRGVERKIRDDSDYDAAIPAPEEATIGSSSRSETFKASHRDSGFSAAEIHFSEGRTKNRLFPEENAYQPPQKRATAAKFRGKGQCGNS